MLTTKTPLLRGDRFGRYLPAQSDVLVLTCVITQTVRDAIERHKLNPLAAMVVSEAMVAATLDVARSKDKERVLHQWHGTGSIGQISVEASSIGEVRAYCQHKQPEPVGDNKSLMLRNAMGLGHLRVARVLSADEQRDSTVPIVDGLIAKDLALFFDQSEQIPSAIRIDVHLNEDMTVAYAAGVMVQTLPESAEASMSRREELESSLLNLDINALHATELNVRTLANAIIGEDDFTETHACRVDFFCPCSKDYYAARLATLPTEDLRDLAQHEQEIRCEYCAETYKYSGMEINAIAEGASAVN